MIRIFYINNTKTLPTTLIILGKLGRYDLLKNLFSKIYIPQEVIKEISVKSDGIFEEIKKNKFFEIKKINDIALFALLDGILDRGESEAIVLAKELNLILLIDEKKGRGVAKNMRINIIGLLGVLILNVRKGYISKDEAVIVLDEIKRLKFRISDRLKESFLKQIDL